jgi:hypothetical protein
MFQKLITVAAWAFLAFIAYSTISPILDRPTLLASASFEHLTAFAVLGASFCVAYLPTSRSSKDLSGASDAFRTGA